MVNKKVIKLSSFLLSLSMFSMLQASPENQLANVELGRGMLVLSTNCDERYKAFSDQEQMQEVSNCSTITNNNSWTRTNDIRTAVKCNPDGTEGKQLLYVTAFINPDALDNLTSWDNGGKNISFTVTNEDGSYTTTTYEGYCTLDTTLESQKLEAEKVINIQNGSITIDPQTSDIQTDNRTHTYTEICGTTPSNNWTIKERKAILCDGNDTEIPEATKYVDGAPKLAEVLEIPAIPAQSSVEAQPPVLEGIATEYQAEVLAQPAIEEQPEYPAIKSDLASGRPFLPAIPAITASEVQIEIPYQAEVNIDDDITASQTQEAIPAQPSFSGRNGRQAYPAVEPTGSTNCLTQQQDSYNDFLSLKEVALRQAQKLDPSTCIEPETEVLATDSIYSQNTTKLGKDSTSASEKIVQEYRKKRIVEYLIALGYREIPKVKQLNHKAINVNSEIDQSKFGMFGDNTFSTSTGLEAYRTISKEKPTQEDLKNIALTALGEPTISDLSKEFNIPVVTEEKKIYRVLRGWYWGSYYNDSYAHYPTSYSETTNYWQMYNWNHDYLQNLYDNYGYQDEAGNFAFDVYFETLYDTWWWWWNDLWVLINNQWVKGDILLSDGLTNKTWNWWYWYGTTVYTIHGQKRYANGFIRYTFPSVPYRLAIWHSGATLLGPYKSLKHVVIPPIETDYSIMKMADESYDKVISLANRIYNYNIVDKTWNLGEDQNGYPAPVANNPGTNRPMTGMETQTFRPTKEDLQNILEGVRNNIQKDKEEFQKITGYSYSNLPLFNFEFKRRKMTLDMEILNQGVMDCSDGRTLKTVVETRNGTRGICTKETDVEQGNYYFTYNPFENTLITAGQQTLRGGVPFTFIDLRDKKYIEDHNLESTNFNQNYNISDYESNNWGYKVKYENNELVEGLLGKVSVNEDKEKCISEIGTNGFTFKDVRDTKNTVVDDSLSNFNQPIITIYANNDQDIITQELELQKQTYINELDSVLNNLSVYIRDDIEASLFDNLKEQYSNSLDYNDDIYLSVPLTNLRNDLTSGEIKSFINLIKNIETPLYTQNTDSDTILFSYNNIRDLDQMDVLNTLYVNKIFIENAQGEFHKYTLLKPFLVKDIFYKDVITNEENIPADILKVRNLESSGLIFYENGIHKTPEEINEALLNDIVYVGFTAVDFNKEETSFTINQSSTYSSDKELILSNALSDTENICANAVYIDYEGDRLIRERLDAWETIIKKTENYFAGNYQGDNIPGSKYYDLYRKWATSGLNATVNTRTSVYTGEECDHMKWSWKPGCKPGGGARLSALLSRAGSDITGTLLKNYLISVAQLSEFSSINRDESFNSKGTTLHTGDLSSSFYSPIYSSPSLKGGSIHQYFEKITYNEKKSWDICRDCTQMTFKTRNIVALELNDALKRLQVAFHKQMAGYLNITDYDKCRNDLHTNGYAEIKRIVFNPNFIKTNPENLINEKNISFTTTPQTTVVNGIKTIKENWIKINNPTVEQKLKFCSNLIRSTKFYQDSDVVINTMEKIKGLDKTVGTIIDYRFYEDNEYKDEWRDKNIFQQEICGGIMIKADPNKTLAEVVVEGGECSQIMAEEQETLEELAASEKAIYDQKNEEVTVLLSSMEPLNEEINAKSEQYIAEQEQLDTLKTVDPINQDDIDNQQIIVDNLLSELETLQAEYETLQAEYDIKLEELNEASEIYNNKLQELREENPSEGCTVKEDIENTDYICSNPIVKENEVDKNLIDIGIAIFDEENGKYDATNFPYKRATIEFIDLYELVTDNETGNSKSLSGSTDLLSEIDKMADYNDKEKIEISYEECLKFKSKKGKSTVYDKNNEEEEVNIYINRRNYFSYKADICTNTDTQHNPPIFVKGEYCHDNCNCEQDKIKSVMNCEDIIYNNKDAQAIENHTCADVDLEKIFNSKEQEDLKNINTRDEIQNSFTGLMNEQSKTKARMDQGIEKEINEETGEITTEYSNSNAAIKATEIETNGTVSDYTSGDQSQVSSQITQDASIVTNINNNDEAQVSSDAKTIDITGTKEEYSDSTNQISSLSGRASSNGASVSSINRNEDYMGTATSKATGGVEINDQENEVETFGKKMNEKDPNITDKNSMENEMSKDKYSANEFSLDCTDCGNWKTDVTEEEVNLQERRSIDNLGLTEEERNPITIDDSQTDKTVIDGNERLDNSNTYRNAQNKEIQEYYQLKEDNSIAVQKGEENKEKLRDLRIGDVINSNTDYNQNKASQKRFSKNINNKNESTFINELEKQ